VRTVSYVLGTALVAVGVALLLSVGAMYAYGAFERVRFERELAETPTAAAVASPPEDAPTSPTRTPTEAPTPVATAARVASTPVSARTPAPTATPRPTSTPTPVILPARRVVAPKIKLDSRIVESTLKDGVWQVPKFVAGHLQGTSDPGKPGNVVLAGHVESISSGNVFADIGHLEPGDRIKLYTDAAEFDYVVAGKLTVKNDDLSVVAPTPEETLTLITCTGNWLPLQRDFDQRLVVVARRVEWSPPVKPTGPGPL